MSLKAIQTPKEIASKLAHQIPEYVIQEREAGKGTTLSYISGATVIDILNTTFGYLGWNFEVLKEWKEECGELQYWIYDYIDTKTPFKERWKVLEAMKDIFTDEDPIKILDQKEMSGYATIKKEHDKYVKEGFEGLCARNPNREYGVNKRSANYLIKLKERKDAEATIIDVKEGLRPEDMCFILRTPDGITFAAKPTGDTATRENYLKNKDEFIGKQMTYTYFELSKDGVPCQPVAIHVRPDDE